MPRGAISNRQAADRLLAKSRAQIKRKPDVGVTLIRLGWFELSDKPARYYSESAGCRADAPIGWGEWETYFTWRVPEYVNW